jgi:hypothetical protein
MVKGKKKTKLRLRYSSLILVLVIVLGFFLFEANSYNSDATGFHVINPLTNPTEIFIFERSVDIIKVNENTWIPDQKYTVDEHRYCIADCRAFAEENGFEIIRANSRSWGKCLCEVKL